MKIPHVLKLASVEEGEVNGLIKHLLLHTDSGVIKTRFHKAANTQDAIIWVGGLEFKV